MNDIEMGLIGWVLYIPKINNNDVICLFTKTKKEKLIFILFFLFSTVGGEREISEVARKRKCSFFENG